VGTFERVRGIAPFAAIMRAPCGLAVNGDVVVLTRPQFDDNAPADAPLLRLAQMQGHRYWVEGIVEDAKDQCGLADHQAQRRHAISNHSSAICPGKLVVAAPTDTTRRRPISRPLERFPVDLIHSVVMRGLDRRIHHLRKIYAKWMAPRVTPENGRVPIQIDREPL